MTATVTDIHKKIIQKSIQGDSKARYELYRHYSRAMFNTCIRIMNNKEDAEDMLQEVFCDAFNKLHTFRFESTFGAWLKRITVNKCLNEVKRRKVSLTLMDEMGEFDSPEEDSLEYEQDIQFTVQKIMEAMQELPEGSRVIFSLYLLEGYEHREIAHMLNISESTSKSQLMRAKKKVRTLVDQMKNTNAWKQRI